MNDFSDLEAELKKLRPAAVSNELSARIERALDEPEREPVTVKSAGVLKRQRFHWNWLPLGLGLAATATFLLLARPGVDRSMRSGAPVVASASRTQAPPQGQMQTPAASPESAGLVPSGLTQVVYNTRDEGLHFTPGSSVPVRRVRSVRKETMRWEDRQTGASLRVTYPAEEVTLIPAIGQ